MDERTCQSLRALVGGDGYRVDLEHFVLVVHNPSRISLRLPDSLEATETEVGKDRVR